MKSVDIRKKYIDFYKARGHTEIPSANLVPEDDPSTLFNSAGMQPLIQYILGAPHPLGKRLVNSQKAFRANDIEEIGDNRHTTFFEMLGNWSLGDYFKKEQLSWVFDFLTIEMKLDPQKLYISVFDGDENFKVFKNDVYQPLTPDVESISIWKEIFKGVGIEAQAGDRIFCYPADKNWWSRSGSPDQMPAGEPGGPDSEVFYDFGPEYKFHENSPFKDRKCHPNCDCGRYLEIANSVFMQYKKQADRLLEELPKKCVDFGGGLERIAAAVQGTPDIFRTDLYQGIIQAVENSTGIKYGQSEEQTSAMRIIADHLKAAVFMINEGLLPSNKQQGYILRRLIRRSVVKMHQLKFTGSRIQLGKDIYHATGRIYDGLYFDTKSRFFSGNDLVLTEEMDKFERVLNKGIKMLERQTKIDGQFAFDMFQSYGFPWELTYELAMDRGFKINRDEFERQLKEHQEKSRTAAKGMFKGGLADRNEETTKLHTATHLIHRALRIVLGSHVDQKGSNITSERLRFDFSHKERLSEDEIKKVEDMVNEQIRKDLPVSYTVTSPDEARKMGALAFFGNRYPEKVKVYTIGNPEGTYFSREICGGPHVKNTGSIGKIKIYKQESAGSGIRRIYASIV